MNDTKLLTEQELLEALNIKADRTAVWRWRQQGMPHVKVGRAIRYDLSTVREWLHERTEIGLNRDPSVWQWRPEWSDPSIGKSYPAGWIELCRCRNAAIAGEIAQALRNWYGRLGDPQSWIRIGTTEPKEPPVDPREEPTEIKEEQS